MDAQTVLEQWQAEDRAARDRAAPQAGVVRRELLAGQPGMALFRAMLAGEVPRVAMAETLDFILVQCEPGHATFLGRPSTRHYNPMGSVHGGWFAALLDSALGCAVHSALPAGKAYTTLEMKINLTRALTDKVPLVRAEGRVIHLGSQTATADARLTGTDGKLYAHGSTTCLVFNLPSTTP